jgi:glycosyltransferase involved in cell wall biosynthesis
MVIPSRQETFGQTASEAPACGTPVVAFDTRGLPDIVEHQRTGYLAKAFETEDLAKGIAWVLAQRDSGQLGQQARERAVARFSERVVVQGYLPLYGAL